MWKVESVSDWVVAVDLGSNIIIIVMEIYDCCWIFALLGIVVGLTFQVNLYNTAVVTT